MDVFIVGHLLLLPVVFYDRYVLWWIAMLSNVAKYCPINAYHDSGTAILGTTLTLSRLLLIDIEFSQWAKTCSKSAK